MGRYSVRLARSARKELEAFHPEARDRLLAALEGLSDEARPAGCQKLRGPADLWRVRVGDHRIVYEIDDRAKVIDVVIIRHRRDVYR